MRFWAAKPAPLYFLHIPKTAGTSVTRWLSEQVGADSTCPAKNWDQLVRVERGRLASYRIFAGHFGMDLQDFLGRKVTTVTLPRDPLLRTLSHYRHVHRDVVHPLHLQVSQQSFRQFVEDQRNWSMIENFQARYLVQGPISFRKVAACYDRAEAKFHRLSVAAEDARFLFDPAWVREQAFAALRHPVSVAGTTDCLRRFLNQVANLPALARVPDTQDVPFENASALPAASEEIDPGTLDLVRDLTTIDQELYDHVKLQTRSAPSAPSESVTA
jgi:Sulfotransferase family